MQEPRSGAYNMGLPKKGRAALAEPADLLHKVAYFML
jgi:hypothetical protein